MYSAGRDESSNAFANKAKIIPTKWLLVLLEFRGILWPSDVRLGFCVAEGVGIENIHLLTEVAKQKHQLLQNCIWPMAQPFEAEKTQRTVMQMNIRLLHCSLLVPIVKVGKQVLRIREVPLGGFWIWLQMTKWAGWQTSTPPITRFQSPGRNRTFKHNHYNISFLCI